MTHNHGKFSPNFTLISHSILDYELQKSEGPLAYKNMLLTTNHRNKRGRQEGNNQL